MSAGKIGRARRAGGVLRAPTVGGVVMEFDAPVRRYDRFNMLDIAAHLRREFSDMPGAGPALYEMFSQNALDFVSLSTIDGYATHELFETYGAEGRVMLLLVKYYERADRDAIVTGGHCVLYLDHIPGGDDGEYMFLLRLEPGLSETYDAGSKRTRIPVKGWQVMNGQILDGIMRRIFIPHEKRPPVEAVLEITVRKNGTALTGSIEFV